MGQEPFPRSTGYIIARPIQTNILTNIVTSICGRFNAGLCHWGLLISPHGEVDIVKLLRGDAPKKEWGILFQLFTTSNGDTIVQVSKSYIPVVNEQKWLAAYLIGRTSFKDDVLEIEGSMESLTTY